MANIEQIQTACRGRGDPSLFGGWRVAADEFGRGLGAEVERGQRWPLAGGWWMVDGWWTWSERVSEREPSLQRAS